MFKLCGVFLEGRSCNMFTLVLDIISVFSIPWDFGFALIFNLMLIKSVSLSLAIHSENIRFWNRPRPPEYTVGKSCHRLDACRGKTQLACEPDSVVTAVFCEKTH